MLHYRRQPVDAGQPVSISVPITEQHWQRDDGRSADRAHLLMVLADLDSILIKATYTTRTTEAAYGSFPFKLTILHNVFISIEI